VSSHDESTSCPLCGGTGAERLAVGYDRMRATAADHVYVRCSGCGLARLDPLPREDEIPGFYPDDYTPHVGGAKRRRDRWINRMATRYYYGTDSVGRSRFARLVFRTLSPHVMRGIREPRGENRLLDIGCGGGELLGRYRDLGWSVKGIEISPRACEVARARDLEIHQGTAFDAPFPTDSFDVVILSHVIEHVLDPVRFLARCGELLAPDGVLICATPNSRAMGLSRYGSCWYPLDAPRHLMLFDPGTIRRLAREAGLRAARVVTRPEPRMYCESRHYLRTQGAVLPADVEERRRILDASARAKRPYRGFRRAIGPFVAIASWFGRGEILLAELVRRRP